jgi:hypothetical protein
MDKREFIQRYMIEHYNENENYFHQIELATSIFNEIEESLTKAVAAKNLWDYNDK